MNKKHPYGFSFFQSNMTFQQAFVVLLLSFLLISPLNADTSKNFGNHTVYYNSFPIDSLPAQMTQRYQLKRSKNMALVNISVVDHKASLMPQGVKSRISGQMKNLLGQSKQLEFKEIHEGKAYYYIAQVKVDPNEIVNFFITARTESGDNYEVKFSKQFSQ